MKIVSEHSARQIEKNEMAKEAERAVAEMTSNLLRCCAGSGKRYLLHDQIVRAAVALERMSTAGHCADSVWYPALIEGKYGEDCFYFGESDIIDYAMQCHASNIAGQLSQLSNARARLSCALRTWADDRARESRGQTGAPFTAAAPKKR
ncbi:hypothetical protein ACSSV8_000012 [Roseovarius sp. MBR-79]|jgi:hypothetical protein